SRLDRNEDALRRLFLMVVNADGKGQLKIPNDDGLANRHIHSTMKATSRSIDNRRWPPSSTMVSALSDLVSQMKRTVRAICSGVAPVPVSDLCQLFSKFSRDWSPLCSVTPGAIPQMRILPR